MCTFELELNFHKLMLCLLRVFDSSPVQKIYVWWRDVIDVSDFVEQLVDLDRWSVFIANASTCRGRWLLNPLR